MTPEQWIKENLVRTSRYSYPFDYNGEEVSAHWNYANVIIHSRAEYGYNRSTYDGVRVLYGPEISDDEIGRWFGSDKDCGGHRVVTNEDGSRRIEVSGCN